MTLNLITMLQSTNPVPDAAELAESDAAKELALRRPGSVLDWRIRGDHHYVGDGYRIRLREPGRWDVTHHDYRIGHERSLKAAFAVAEHHRREALRRRELITWAGIAGLLLLAGWLLSTVASEVTLAWVVYAVVALWLGIFGVVRVSAVLARNLDDPYRRLLPWERRR